MKISVIVVNWNTKQLLRECLASVVEFTPSGADVEVVVVDNASEDGSAAMVEAEFPNAILIKNDINEGFGRANNRAMKVATGDYYFLLNSDARLVSDAHIGLAKYLEENPNVGIVAPRLITPDGGPQTGYGDFPSPLMYACEHLGLKRFVAKERIPQLGRVIDDAATEPFEVDYVSGAALMIRAPLMRELGGFHPGYVMYFEETDLCFRAKKAGVGIFAVPNLSVVHHLGKSLLTRQDRDIVAAKLIFLDSEVRFYARNYSKAWARFIRWHYMWRHGSRYLWKAIRGKGKTDKAVFALRHWKRLREMNVGEMD